MDAPDDGRAARFARIALEILGQFERGEIDLLALAAGVDAVLNLMDGLVPDTVLGPMQRGWSDVVTTAELDASQIVTVRPEMLDAIQAALDEIRPMFEAIAESADDADP